ADEGASTRIRAYLDRRGAAGQGERSREALRIAFLQPGDRVVGEEPEEAHVVEGRAGGEPQRERPRQRGFRGDPRPAASAQAPQFARRRAVDLGDRVVELAEAAETGGEGDVGDAQLCRGEQRAGRLRPVRASEGEGPRAELGT